MFFLTVSSVSTSEYRERRGEFFFLGFSVGEAREDIIIEMRSPCLASSLKGAGARCDDNESTIRDELTRGCESNLWIQTFAKLWRPGRLFRKF